MTWVVAMASSYCASLQAIYVLARHACLRGMRHLHCAARLFFQASVL